MGHLVVKDVRNLQIESHLHRIFRYFNRICV